MIDAGEIQARALRLGLLPSHIETDHVLNHVLAALAESDAELTFRGGTALARVYWPDFRLSEDLDFITAASASALEEPLRWAVATAGKRAGLRLHLDLGTVRDDWYRSIVVWEGGRIVLDVNIGERCYLPAETRELRLPYSDLLGGERPIRIQTLDEILGNKWYMLDDRQEPRDLFDLWAGLCKFGVPFGRVARGHQARYGTGPVAWWGERVKTLKANWELRLRHQVADLPDFDSAQAAVRRRFEAWRLSASTSAQDNGV